MNVFIQELKWNIKSALIWGIALGSVGFFFIYLYPSFSSDMESVNELFAQYPPEILKALGVGAEGIGSFHGFYSFVLVYVILCGAIQGLITGIQVIGKEGARKTSDFLFSKPISRYGILFAKYLSAMVSILITGVIYVFISYLCTLQNGGDFDKPLFLLLSTALILTQLLFTAMGFCIGCFLKKAKSPSFIGIGVGALFFGIQMIANMYEERLLEFLSPMSYINPSYIASHKEFDMPLFICLIIVLILSSLLGFWRYQTKDIHSA